MITEERLISEIQELEAAPVTLRNCEALAVLRFLHNTYYAEIPEVYQGYSGAAPVGVPKVSNSDFIQAVSRIDTTDAWKILDWAMTIMQPLYPKMYNSIMRKINEKQAAE